MSFNQVDRQELKELVREVVVEELERLRSKVAAQSTENDDDSDIDDLARQLFDRYDDVFKALA